VVAVAEYQHLAYAAIDDILARGRTPFLVGGSGLYIQAVVRGYQFPQVPPDPPLRQALEKEAQVRGNEWLHAQLAAVDPVAAEKTHPNNVGRVIRALEVHRATGVPISEFWRSRQVRYDPILIGIIRDRERLYQRIDLRVEQMLAGGLVREVEQILNEGYSADSPALAAIGYKELVPHLQGRVDLDTVAVEIKRATRRFVRQQLNTWFRPDDARITWFDVDAPDTGDRIRRLLESTLPQVCNLREGGLDIRQKADKI
jgi:tRNA dimethylallyltransferase